MEDDFDIERSPFCQVLTSKNKSVYVDIYRGLEEAKATVRDEGIDVLIGPEL